MVYRFICWLVGLDFLAKHYALAGFRGCLVLRLEHADAWNRELTGFLNLFYIINGR